MVLDKVRVEQLCKAVEMQPILWDPSREDYKFKDRTPKGKAAKAAVLNHLKEQDAQFWSSFAVGTVMGTFRGYKQNYAKWLSKVEQQRQTKSGQAPDDELHIKSYCHAEFLRFLDGTAVGSFGTEDPTTNVLSISDDEISVEGGEEDEALVMAENDLNRSMERDTERVISELTTAASQSGSVLGKRKVIASCLKNGNKSKYARERNQMRDQTNQFAEGFSQLSSALVASLAAPHQAPTPAPGPSDQFSAFGDTIVQRLRAMDETDALSAMAQISAIIFAPIRAKNSYFNLG
ncbi:uncharacterized protein LOC134821649 [Bolinopsis microptera]|uniref:uncharacterized protein LOC134821649 n=1 Tax=Bolinopsis microptera TaxID=2820187 RepID=UPI00307B0B04